MPSRRSFIQLLSSVPFLGPFLGSFVAPYAAAAPISESRDFFKELGVRPFINAAGTFTVLTASLMKKEVVEAMNYASRQFVPLNDLHAAVGKHIASLIGCEGAMVTSGAAAALTVGTAACLTEKNA